MGKATAPTVGREVLRREVLPIHQDLHQMDSAVDKGPPKTIHRDLQTMVSKMDKEPLRVNWQDPKIAVSTTDKGTSRKEDSTTHKDHRDSQMQLQIYKRQLRASFQVSKWRPFRRYPRKRNMNTCSIS